MLDALRKFFQTKAGTVVAAMFGVAGIAVIIMVTMATFGSTEAENFSNDRMFIDADTGKAFKYEIKIGSTIPVPAPSGKNTGYPAESCYWTKDGKIKQEPTYVLLDLYRNKGSKEPTFCPDCGRLVVPHNPFPTAESTPPPTKQEYKPSRNPLDQR